MAISRILEMTELHDFLDLENNLTVGEGQLGSAELAHFFREQCRSKRFRMINLLEDQIVELYYK